MLHGKNIHSLLQETLRPVHTLTSDHEALYSSIIVSGINGSIISYANSEVTPATYNKSSNNLKMMALLIRDKWNEDQLDSGAQTTSSCYRCELAEGMESTYIYTYELEDLHACVAQIPRSDLLLLFIASDQYPFGLEVLKLKSAINAFSSMYGYKLN
ncbi:LANO_0F13256g1_1 [Lachancea nothofagi CBS 11611]|uniref:LANO_0F13256g1_1 n=1 Tax=Lachancea nothofagi CBS 11611 TaxID=1266666 RepID=A0A1G4KBQ6_9SACH|nr:LANO_0F13256g1_1 [Lachancea nothofagi CBS 11611]